MQHQEMEEQLPVRGLMLQDQAQVELLPQHEVPVPTDQGQLQEEQLALMPLQETEHIEQAEVPDLFRDIQVVHEMAIPIGDILPETVHIAGAQQQIDQAQQEGLMEVLHNEVPDIPGRLPPCLEPPAIVPEEVRVLEAHLVIEVLGLGVPEVQGAIEVLEGPEAQVATEVPGGLQDLLAACEVRVVVQEVPVEA